MPFALKDGRRDIITPTARRTYDHIINSRIGSFPLNGLTGKPLTLSDFSLLALNWILTCSDEQVRNILSASRLAPNEIEAIWQLTETIDAKGLPDGSWTQLEIYIILHYAQASEALSLETMAMQYAGSIPPKPAEEIRRRSSYAEEGLRLRASLNHDPMPSSPSPALTTILRHSTSNATTLSMVRDPLFTHRIQDTGDALLSQPGLEALGPIEEGATYRLGSSRRPLRESSIRTSTTDGAQKLHDLIQSKCPDVHIEPDIQTLQPRSFQSSSLDDAVARDILIRKKVEIGDFKESSKQLSNILKSKKGRQKAADNANSTFNQTELSAALRETVDGSGEVGVAKALIDMGAQINSYKETSKSKWRGSRTESIPINYVKIAASHNNEDMVSLLASSGASSSNLVEALEQSVRQNRPNIVLALLQQGVNWMTRSESIFASAIASKNPTLVRPLLRWPLKNRKNLVSSNLPTAVDYGQYEVVSLLMKYGADPRSQNALAMKKAVQAQRVDIVLAMMKDIEGSARSTIASSIFMEAFSSRSSQNAREQYEQYVMLESLLYYGARGDPVACMLVQVVRAGRQSIARLLVKYGADVQYHDAEALRVAIATENSKMLSILLVAKVTQRTASGIVDEIPGTSSDDESSWMLSLLIAKGAAGPPLTKVLVRAVEHKWYKTMGLLLDHRADVEFEGSQPLRMAVTGGDEQSLNLLLSKGRPKTETMQLLLPLIPQDPPRLRFVMTKAIINAAGQDGIAASVLSDALVEILSHPSREVHQYLVPLADVLITAGARVDHKRGKCFQLAAEIGSTELLDLLNQHVSKVGSLSPAMSTCMKTRDPEKRKALVGILLKGGAKGSEVDQALIDAIDEELIDKALVHHLLEKADLNYLGGRALSTALQRRPCDLTAAIIETGRTTKKVRSDALKSLFEPDVKERRTKLCLLLQAGVEQDALDNALVQEIEGKRDSQIVKNLLSHGASCNYKNGKALDLAIHLQDVHSLEQLIQSHPSRLVLEAMISKAMSVERTNSRRACLSLLFREGAKGERASFALIQEVETSGYRDPQTLQLLVNSGATIDYLEGRALRFAVSYPLDITVVRILVSGIGASTVISSLLPLALKHRSSVRVPLLQILLEKGASGNDINESLVTAVSEGAHAQSTIDLLLKHKASVNSDGARAVKKAAELKACSVLESLLRNYNRKHIDEIIGLAMQLPSSPSQEQRLDRLRCVRLLTPPTVTNPELVNSPLIQAVKERDRELIEYLISAGANANSNAGRSVVIAAEQRDFGSLQVLMRSKIKPTSQTCSSAFSVLPHTHDRWQTIPETVQKFDGILISEGAVGLAVDQTFLNALRSPHAFAADFIHLALRSKTLLNPNHDAGAALCIASKEARLAVVDYLLACRPSEPTLQAAFMSVFESPVEERTLIKLARMFFAHSQSASHVDFRRSEILESALYEALRRHSDKPDFIQELLNNGCKAEYSWSGKYNGSNIAEQMSTLLWLLCEGGQEVDVRIVDSLLEAGGKWILTLLFRYSHYQ